MPDGGGQTSTSTQQSGPPAYLAPYLQYGAQQAAKLYQSPSPSFFPGSLVADQSPYTQAATQMAAARVTNGNPLENASQGYLQNVVGGAYLGSNPYLGAVDQSVRDAVIPSVESQMSLGGRYGSPTMGSEMTRQLADAIAPYHYNDYQAERGMQQQAAGMAPTFASQDWQDIGNLQQAGAGLDQFEQNKLNAGIDRWNYNQGLAGNKLRQYMGLLLNPAFGSTQMSTQTQPQPGGGIGGFLGGLLGGIL